MIAELKILDNIYLLDSNFPCPKYQTKGSAAVDLQSVSEDILLKSGESLMISTGIAIHLADDNFVGMVYPRSGLGSKHGIVLGNGTGVIDSDYTGEIKVCLWNRSDKNFIVEKGMRIAQYMVVPVERVSFNVVEDFTSNSGRGDSGFGSTGLV